MSMNLRAFFILAASTLLLSGCGQSLDLPGLQSGKYRVRPYLRVAARIQGMGRQEACQTLMKVAKTNKQDDQVIVLCRMLFEKRAASEFRRPMIGAASFMGGTNYPDWPLEPIELIDGVPFLIVRGYELGGEPEPAESYLRYCMANCDWRTTPFREPTAKELCDALDKLVSFGRWMSPLDTHELTFFSAQIE